MYLWGIVRFPLSPSHRGGNTNAQLGMSGLFCPLWLCVFHVAASNRHSGAESLVAAHLSFSIFPKSPFPCVCDESEAQQECVCVRALVFVSGFSVCSPYQSVPDDRSSLVGVSSVQHEDEVCVAVRASAAHWAVCGLRQCVCVDVSWWLLLLCECEH